MIARMFGKKELRRNELEDLIDSGGITIETDEDEKSKQAKEAFDTIDTDGSATLNKVEIEKALRAMNKSEQEIKTLLNSIKRPELTLEEFQQLLKGIHAREENCVQQAAHCLIERPWFDNTITMLIILNTVLLATRYFDYEIYTRNYRQAFFEHCGQALAVTSPDAALNGEPMCMEQFCG